MPRPEQIKKSLIGALIRIILNPYNLCMVRCVGADILVRRIVRDPLSVPNLSLSHARDPLVSKLHPPEATGGELSKLVSRRRYIVVRFLS